jgi:hypothetical protein
MQNTDVRETAQNAVNQGKSLVTKIIDDRTSQLGKQIEAGAQELRKVGEQLRENAAGSLAAGYVEQGAQFVEELGRYLEDADSERLIADLENYARKQPWVIAGAALMLGFATSRFLKASSARRYREGGDAGYGGAEPYGSSTYRGSTYGDTTYGDESQTRGRGGRRAT